MTTSTPVLRISTPIELPYLILTSAGDPRPAMLARGGLRMTVAHSIDAAFRALSATRFAGVIVDVALAGEDTLTFVAAVRGHVATRDLTVVAIGCTTATSKALARQCGADITLASLPTTEDRLARRHALDESGVFRTDADFGTKQEKRRPPYGARLDEFSLSYERELSEAV